MLDEKQMSFAVISIVALTAVISTVFLVVDGGYTADMVNPFNKVYVDSSRTQQQLLRDNIPSSMTSCGQGFQATQDSAAANDPTCQWNVDLKAYCCPLSKFISRN